VRHGEFRGGPSGDGQSEAAEDQDEADGKQPAEPAAEQENRGSNAETG